MTADLILHNAIICTVDPVQQTASAMAMKDGRLTYVGDSDTAMQYANEHTDVRDMAGAFLMPGIVDGHNHPALAGRTALFELEIPEIASFEEILELIECRASTQPEGTWIVGAGWNVGLLEQLNTATALQAFDAVSNGCPIVLVDNSRHNRWANTEAMHLGDVTSDTEGAMYDAQGNPSGVLLERAGLPVAYAAARQGGRSTEQEQQAYHHSLEILHSYGITAFQDAGVTEEILRALHGMDSAGELDAWVVSSLLMNDEVLGAEVLGVSLLEQAEEHSSEHHRPSFVKIFLDGIPPSRTSAMLEPYLEDTHHGCGFCGSTILSPDELYEALKTAAERGFGAKIHSTGDASTRLILDTVEQLKSDGWHLRCQIAHGQYVADEDIVRFKELDVAADISPYFWYPSPVLDAIKTAVPEQRAERIHPNRDLLDAGVLVSAGSDWPVSPVPNPWHALAGLVTRQDPTATYPGALWPEQAITLEQALEVMTLNGARMIGVDDVTGALVAGLSADFVVLNHNPFELDPADLGTLAPVETWFAGTKVFG